jgi:dihydrodipicolinate synthase/N-acetylneuraminate lyase
MSEKGFSGIHGLTPLGSTGEGASALIPLFVFMMGGVGWMAGPACLIPEQCVALYTLAQEQKWEQALELQKRLWSLNAAFQRYSLAACVKAGLEMQGFPVGPPLLPQRQLDEEGKKSFLIY